VDDILSQVLPWLAGVNPLVAFGLLAVWLVFGDKIKDVLARLRPSAPNPADPLEDHPLLDLLWRRLKSRFADKPLDEDDDDLYVRLVKALKDAK